MNIGTRKRHKNWQLLLFPEPQGGPTRDVRSLDRRKRVVKAVQDYYRRSK